MVNLIMHYYIHVININNNSIMHHLNFHNILIMINLYFI